MGATMTNLDPKRWPALFIGCNGPLHSRYAEAAVAFRDHHPWSLSEYDEQMWAAAFDAELAALIRERQAEALEALADRTPAPGSPPPTWARFEGILRSEAGALLKQGENHDQET